jgi:ABC-2 type transport system permease protein
MIRTVLQALWRKEWLALSRDRFGLGAIFVMPAVFILVMSLALRDTLRPGGAGLQLRYAVIDLDDSVSSREMVELLAGQSFIPDSAHGVTETSTREAIAAGRLPFSVVIPKGFEGRLTTELGAPGLVTLRLDPTVAALARSAFRQHLLGVLGTLKARSFLRSVDPMFGGAAASSMSPQSLQNTVAEEAVGSAHATAPPTAVQQNVPAWLIFGMFFVVLPITAIFITERQHGTLQRLRSMGIGHGTLLAGKLIPFIGVNMIQTILMLSVGVWLVPRFGGEALSLPRSIWPPLAAMAVVVSFAAVSWALLVASIVRTTEQATVVGGVGNILMGAIGGIMVPRFVMPAEMRALTNLSPMAWGLEGFHSVMLRGEGWTGLLPTATRLILFALLSLTLATWLSRRGNRPA